MKFGEKVEHVLSKDWVLILEVDGDVITCRTKDMRLIKFHRIELKEINRK